MTTATATRTSMTRTPYQDREEQKAPGRGAAPVRSPIRSRRSATPADWAAFLTFAQAFHRILLNNVLLILRSAPKRRTWRGFRKWQSPEPPGPQGPRAASGSSAGSTQRRRSRTTTTGDEVENKRRARFFPILSVFDLGQTDLIDPDAGRPQHPRALLTGADRSRHRGRPQPTT